MEPSTDLLSLQQRLEELAITIRNTEMQSLWTDVENVSRGIANGLRVRDREVDNHTLLGNSELPQSLASLISLALHVSATPALPYTDATFELLRVAANLCMDHDGNRGHLLDASVPQLILSILEGYAEAIPLPRKYEPLVIEPGHLKVVRTAIGVLLNASMGYEPIKNRLNSLEAALTILKLSTSIYPPGAWINLSSAQRTQTSEDIEEEWSLRSSISNWAWRTVSELRDVKDESLQLFNPDVLPLITTPLLSFCAPYPETAALFEPESPIFSNLLEADFESLEETCTLLESLSLDVKDIRLALARGLYFPAEHSGVPCLSSILSFIEDGTYPPLWQTGFSEAERKRKEKSFDICKAALIKSVVEVAGEETSADVLWDDSEDGKPGGKFVCKMVSWIKQYIADVDSGAENLAGREDLVICASLSLGNLARREKNSTALLSPPHSLAPLLASKHFLSPTSDLKLKHGILGLLKNLAQSAALSPSIHTSLGSVGIVQRISEGGIWDEKSNIMADVVQLNAIGVVKHLCNANIEHTLALVLPVEDSTSTTGLSQILALVSRSESVPIKSEGTRVIVNVVKSLWSNNLNTSGATNDKDETVKAELQRRRDLAISAVLTLDYAVALANLVTRSGKYPILVNEGIIALSLLSTHKQGGPLVLKAITTALPATTSTQTAIELPSSASTSSDISSPLVVTPPSSARLRLPVPRHALDMLIFVLRNVDNPVNFPVEVRTNACSFLAQLTRHVPRDELSTVQEAARPVLEAIVKTTKPEDPLHKPCKRVLDIWRNQ
ncbi:hypothetical protein BDQ12DRAFT_703078 [Crucibulum laeve]|uniref:Armadillo-type protein n=1 Tax=Crucibulum laeve TaxID=68775 RepID=A0A5C3MDB0_9AGAR|nr:hypothetical protein BDQ12DRAFT_703078 [Crucibulum laeve]